MNKKFIVGFLATVIVDSLLVVLFYVISRYDPTNNVLTEQLVPLFVIPVIIFVFITIILRLITRNQNSNGVFIRIVFIAGSGIGILASVISSFKDYYSIIGIIFLIPVLIPTVIIEYFSTPMDKRKGSISKS